MTHGFDFLKQTLNDVGEKRQDYLLAKAVFFVSNLYATARTAACYLKNTTVASVLKDLFFHEHHSSCSLDEILATPPEEEKAFKPKSS